MDIKKYDVRNMLQISISFKIQIYQRTWNMSCYVKWCHTKFDILKIPRHLKKVYLWQTIRKPGNPSVEVPAVQSKQTGVATSCKNQKGQVW